MRHICLYTLDPDFHCVRAGGCAGSPEVVQEALADLKKSHVQGGAPRSGITVVEVGMSIITFGDL